jgi:hypothetical protein
LEDSTVSSCDLQSPTILTPTCTLDIDPSTSNVRSLGHRLRPQARLGQTP